MRRTLAAPGLAAVLGMALLLTACGKTNAHNNTAGETVSTALFDFSITDVSLVESYPGIDIPDGECLVRMRLNIKNTSSQTYTMFLQDFQIQWGEGDSDYGTCLNAVDDTMMPYAYELTPGQERSDWLMAEIPDGSTSCTIAYAGYGCCLGSLSACIGVCRNRDHRGSCCTRSSGGGCTGQHR